MIILKALAVKALETIGFFSEEAFTKEVFAE